MPAFVIVHGFERTGETDAIICDPSPVGVSDRKTATPVRVQLFREQTLSVNSKACGIISNVGENGVNTALEMLSDWLNVELATAAARSMGVEGARNEHTRS
jgi:hypothetical protein